MRLKTQTRGFKILFYLLLAIYIQIITVDGTNLTMTIDAGLATTNYSNTYTSLCSLPDLFPFILGIMYAVTSLLMLMGVSYWSFKSMTGKNTT